MTRAPFSLARLLAALLWTFQGGCSTTRMHEVEEAPGAPQLFVRPATHGSISLPILTGPAIAALEHRHYTPASCDGKAIDTEQVCRINFRLPR